jgi:hypothetical protein
VVVQLVPRADFKATVAVVVVPELWLYLKAIT